MAAPRKLLSHLLLGTLFLASASAFADIGFRNWDDPDAPKWEEKEYQTPAFPKDEDLLEFYVSTTATNKYYVDAKSISVGKADKVVRYTMVVKTPGGAKNISFEGLRCDDAQLRIYATGRADGTWAKARDSEWKPLRAFTLNLHQGALARNFFCPLGVPIFTPDEGRNALRRGKHPDAPN